MRNTFLVAIVLLITSWIVSSCMTNAASDQDILTDAYPEEQIKLRAIIEDIYQDAMNADTSRLMAIHLTSPKFSKFGPRRFERQSIDETNRSEAAFFSSISNLQVELKDVRIDVFHDVAVTTFYPFYYFEREGTPIQGSSRQTFVFLKTGDEWKIIHEHGTPRM